MLYELPNGDWIDPATVKSIRVLPRLRGADVLHPPRVAIDAAKFAQIVLLFESDEDASAYARLLAGVCNGSSAELPKDETVRT